MSAAPKRGPGKTQRYRATQPPVSAWLSAAHAAARETLTKPSDVLAGSTKGRCALARRIAWQAVLDAFPDVSIAGLARVSGFDHTSILSSLGRRKASRPMSKLSIETAPAKLPQPVNYFVPVYGSVGDFLKVATPVEHERWVRMRRSRSFISAPIPR